jgi:beta-glucosidase
MDVEAPETIHFGNTLAAAVRAGDVSEERIDDAVRRVLRSLLRTLAAPDPETYTTDMIACDTHVALAREAAEKSIVLLKNDGTLPWEPANARRLLVLGRLADLPNLGDHGSSRVHPSEVITPLAGLRAACPQGGEITYDPGDDLERVRRLASEADVVLVVAGYTHEDEGEFIPHPSSDPSAEAIGGDRLDLTLGETQEALVLAAADANANTVVAVMAGSAVLMEAWRQKVAGILMLWYPGMAGGAALANVLFGAVNPSGHLPFTIPQRAEDLPFFDRDAKAITYDLWHGYTKLERDRVAPAFAFGFGLSYTEFTLTNPSVSVEESAEKLRVDVDVTNAGEREGATVTQVYAGPATPSADHPVKRLCGFRRDTLAAGEQRRVGIDVRLKDLAFFDVGSRRWRLAGPEWRIHVAASSTGTDARVVTARLPERTWSIRER